MRVQSLFRNEYCLHGFINHSCPLRPCICLLYTSVRTKAHSIYESYLSDYKDYDPPFKRHGMQTIAFAQNEPKLFSLLFMQPDVGKQNFKQALTLSLIHI